MFHMQTNLFHMQTNLSNFFLFTPPIPLASSQNLEHSEIFPDQNRHYTRPHAPQKDLTSRAHAPTRPLKKTTKTTRRSEGTTRRFASGPNQTTCRSVRYRGTKTSGSPIFRPVLSRFFPVLKSEKNFQGTHG